MKVAELEDAYRAARARLARRVRRTPLLFSSDLSAFCERPVYLKCENVQQTGAFKYRGALNALLAREDEARRHGVVASSSGNFAMAAAWAARELSIAATLVMMPDAAKVKVDACRRWGADVVFCEGRYEARQEVVDRIRRETGALALHPHDAVETIAGNATLAAEILDDLPDTADVVVPVSGGGLLGGIGAGLLFAGSSARVHGVQPAGNTAFARAFESGRRGVGPAPRTICDGLTATRPGKLGFALAQEVVADIVTVPEEEILPAVKRLALRDHLVVEPSGAVGVAAAVSGRFAPASGPLVLVLSGGNIGEETLRAALEGD